MHIMNFYICAFMLIYLEYVIIVPKTINLRNIYKKNFNWFIKKCDSDIVSF